MADVKLKVDAGVVNARKSKQYSRESEAWAVGKKDGVDVPNTADQYHNNSKYYKEIAMSAAATATNMEYNAGQDALNSEAYAVGKRNGSDVTSGDPAYHNNSKYFAIEAWGYSGDAENAKIDAVSAKNAAASSKLDSEAYAVGKRNGSDVTSGDPAYHNNSKYYSGEASSSASSASSSASTATSKAQDSEAYAVGKRGGVDVTSGDPAYQNNSKYYSTQAASSATAASGSATAAASSATAAAASASAIAATYDSTKTYAVGEYCLYNGGMYVCTTAITVAEAWTAGHWSAVKVGTELTALKEDLYYATGNKSLPFSNPSLKQYIVTNGSTVQWDTPSVSSLTNIKWCVVACAVGDTFVINGKGGNSDRLWAFADASKNIISNASANATATDLVLTAPQNAAYLIVNDEIDSQSYYGVSLLQKTNDVRSAFAESMYSEYNLINKVGNKFPMLTRVENPNDITSPNNYFAFGDFVMDGTYLINVYTEKPVSIFVFTDWDANALTLLDEYDITPVNGKASIYINAVGRCMIAFKGAVKYSTQGDTYRAYNVFYANGEYTHSSSSFKVQFDLEFFSINANTSDYISAKDYFLPSEKTQLCYRIGESGSGMTVFNSVFGFGPSLEKGIYKIKLYTEKVINVFVFNVSDSDPSALAVENIYSLNPVNGIAERLIKINNQSMLGVSGKIRYTISSSLPHAVDFYNISVTNNTYTRSLAGKITFDLDLYRYDDPVPQSNYRTGVPYIALSSDEVKIKLIGDSITQGSGSTGYIEFTDGGYTYRGNAPNYPGAGSDYQVGDYLGEKWTVRWYEAINGSGWGQLIKSLFEEKFNCSVKNYGMGGARTTEILDSLDSLVSDSDDVVTVMLGTNDMREINQATYTSQLDAIISSIKGKNKQVILISPPPVKASVDAGANFHMEDVNNICSAIAYKHGVQFISTFNLVQMYCETKGIAIDSLLNSDGVHPNDSGYLYLFKVVTNGLGLGYKRNGSTW